MLDIQETTQDRARGPQSPANAQPGQYSQNTPQSPQEAPQGARRPRLKDRPILLTLHAARCRGNEQNTSYPDENHIRTLDELRRVLKLDHMAAKMVNSYRHTDNFMECDCIMFDIDNTHTEEPDEWITEKDIAEALPVNYYLVRSRNYMKPKRKKDKKTGQTIILEAREKWHVYAPLKNKITRRADYEKLIKNVVALFPYIDISAIDAARFFYGVPDPHITFEAGEGCIDEYIENTPPEALRMYQEDAIAVYVEKIEQGLYKNDKAAQTTIKTVYEVLGLSDQSGPLPDQPTEGAPGDAAPDWIENAEQTRSLHQFEQFAAEHNIWTGKRYRISTPPHAGAIAICVICPWEHEHSPGGAYNETVVIIDVDGKKNFLCRHSHGAGLSWKNYRAYYEHQEQEETPLPPMYQDQPADYLTAFFEKISGEDYKPYSTGITFFDNLLSGGPIKQTLLLLLAAPAAGKTTLLQQVSESIARHGKPVLYLNLEMSREQMLSKSISARATFKGHPMTTLDVMQGYRWTDQQRQVIQDLITEYRETVAPWLDYNPDGITGDLDTIREYLQQVSKATEERRQQLREAGKEAEAEQLEAPAVVLDYLHLVSCKGEDIQETIKMTMAALKDYAIQNNTLAVAISATNRDSMRDGRITINSGRDSSGIEYGADYILSLNYYQIDQGNVKPSEIEKVSILNARAWRQMIIRVLKGRLCEAGRPAKVYFHAAGNRFYAEDDFLPDEINIVRFGESDAELENAGRKTQGAEGVTVTQPQNMRRL